MRQVIYPHNKMLNSDARKLAPVSTNVCAGGGVARTYPGASHGARFLQSRREGEGQGRCREAGSEGSPIRNCGAMNKNRI